MSHATAYVRFAADGLVVFAEYDGTMDMIIPRLYATPDDLWDGWRSAEARTAACKCNSAEPAEYCSTYGSGSYGPVQACRHCMVIATADAWNEDQGYSGPEWRHGMPEWARNAEKRR